MPFWRSPSCILKLWFVHLEVVSVALCVFDKRRKYMNIFLIQGPLVQWPQFSGIRPKQRVHRQPESCHCVHVLEVIHFTQRRAFQSRMPSLFTHVLHTILAWSSCSPSWQVIVSSKSERRRGHFTTTSTLTWQEFLADRKERHRTHSLTHTHTKIQLQMFRGWHWFLWGQPAWVSLCEHSPVWAFPLPSWVLCASYACRDPVPTSHSWSWFRHWFLTLAAY